MEYCHVWDGEWSAVIMLWVGLVVASGGRVWWVCLVGVSDGWVWWVGLVGGSGGWVWLVRLVGPAWTDEARTRRVSRYSLSAFSICDLCVASSSFEAMTCPQHNSPDEHNSTDESTTPQILNKFN